MDRIEELLIELLYEVKKVNISLDFLDKRFERLSEDVSHIDFNADYVSQRAIGISVDLESLVKTVEEYGYRAVDDEDSESEVE